MIKITTNLLKHSREDFFKGIKLHRKLMQKTNCIRKSLKIFKKKIILGVGPFYLPLTLFISETLTVKCKGQNFFSDLHIFR